MEVVIRGKIADLVSFIVSVKKRDRIFRKAASGSLPPGAMNLLAGSLHPLAQELRVTSATRLAEGIFRYRLTAAKTGGKLAGFRAGQYLACYFEVGNSLIGRPYSICSTPADALDFGFYEITAKSDERGFIGALIAERWKLGSTFACSGPAGFFHYQELRDGPQVVCLAGGTGITPFRSIIADSLSRAPGPSFFLFHGARNPGELIFLEEFRELQARYPDRLSYFPVCEMAESDWTRGFITRKLIEESVRLDGRQSFFVCGPPGMQAFMDGELAPLDLPRRRLRRESYGLGGPASAAGSPASPTASVVGAAASVAGAAKHSIRLAGSARASAGAFSALPGETILVALERAGLSPPSLCRGGQCGWCRSRLVSGEIEVTVDREGIRQADRKFGYFHPCVSFPRSDIVMDIPDNPIRFQ